jgi:hypothetical protein
MHAFMQVQDGSDTGNGDPPPKGNGRQTPPTDDGKDSDDKSGS